MSNRYRAILACLLVGLMSPAGGAAAATFECSRTFMEVQVSDLEIPSDRPYCWTVHMTGPITPGDVEAFKEWLRREPYTFAIKIASPGGSVDVAMEIGRIIRSRFMRVWTYNHEPARDRGCSVKQAREAQIDDGLPTDDTAIEARRAICLKNTDCLLKTAAV